MRGGGKWEGWRVLRVCGEVEVVRVAERGVKMEVVCVCFLQYLIGE